MKKTLLTVLLLVIVALGVTGCGTENDFDIGNVSDIKINDNSDVILSGKDGTLKNTGVTLILENDSDKLLRYDEYYKMEKRITNGTQLMLNYILMILFGE